MDTKMFNLNDQQQEQLRDFRECFIEYKQITDIYNVFDRLMFNCTVGGEQQSLLLTGDTGSGKSALINHYLQRFPKIQNRWADMPVLNTRIPGKIKEQNTLERFLLDLDSTVSNRVKRSNREGSLLTSVIKTLIRKKVRLIIVNEIQELIEFKDAEERQTIANTFKMISEDASVSFVLVGMPYSSLLADESQWNSRLGWRRHLDYFHLFKTEELENGKILLSPNEDGKIHFAKFVAGLAARMGFAQRPNLTSDDILLPLFAVCHGECRALKHFLSDALLNTLSKSANTIDIDILSDTFDFKYPSIKVNPFKCELKELNIRELRSETWYDQKAQFKEDRIIDRTFTDVLPIHMLLSKKPLQG